MLKIQSRTIAPICGNMLDQRRSRARRLYRKQIRNEKNNCAQPHHALTQLTCYLWISTLHNSCSVIAPSPSPNTGEIAVPLNVPSEKSPSVSSIHSLLSQLARYIVRISSWD